MTRDRCERCLETSQAEAEGNRTPLTEVLGHNGFEASDSEAAATPLTCANSL
jgi:hypothetical protein